MKKAIKNILVPINFSDSADNAIKTAIAMCKRHQAVLHLLQTKNENHNVFPPGKNAAVLGLMLEAEVAELDRLESQANQIMDEHQITCFYHLADGPVHRSVASKARDLYCDLIIIQKKSSRAGFSLIRSNSIYKTLKRAGCPVLTVPSEKKYLDFRKVLFPIRPVQAGLKKLETALPIIQKNHSEVLLFAPLQASMKEADQQQVANLVAQADQKMAANSVQVEKEINLTDDMAAEVVSKAIENQSDLIVITATLKRGFRALFTSDYTKRVIESSPVPVLSVKL